MPGTSVDGHATHGPNYQSASCRCGRKPAVTVIPRPHASPLDVVDACRNRRFHDYIVCVYLILDWKKVPSKVTSK